MTISSSIIALIIAAGLTSSLISYSGNRLLSRDLAKDGSGKESIIRKMGVLVIPAVEESVKSSAAYAFGIVEFLPLVHAVFGIVEGIDDVLTSMGHRSSGGRRARGILAGFTAVLTHLCFGVIAAAVYTKTGSLIGGIVAASGFHMCWNAVTISPIKAKERGR